MAQLWLALVLIAVLISAVQCAWMRVAGRLDLALLPSAARHRVDWLLTHSTRIQLTLGVVAAGALGARVLGGAG